MLRQFSSLNFIFLLLSLAFCGVITQPLNGVSSRPGCPTHCGDLLIPFPFGLGSSCSLGPSFDIVCNTSTNPPKPYLNVTKTEVIGFNESSIRVKYPNMASACYNLSDNKREFNSIDGYSITIDLSETPYTLSDANWVTALGCDDMVVGLGKGRANFVSSCVSFCAEMNDSGGVGSCAPDNADSYSPGNGCCRSRVPRGTTYLEANLTDLHGNWRESSRLFRCSYAYIGEKETVFEYPLNYLDNSTAFQNGSLVEGISAPPVVLDWKIGVENCSQARRSSATFLCQQNSSVCVDLDANVGGYLCRCNQGYEGNPYLSSGCQDIDECADLYHNNCQMICMNVPGSYKCMCPKGYFGDGKKDGFGCTGLPSKTMNYSIGLTSGIGFILLVSTCFWSRKLWKRRKQKMRKEKFFKRNGGLLLQQETTSQGSHTKSNLFTSKELEKATDQFNESRILGQGGQGTVYKGMLPDGKIVAIKKSKIVDEDQLEVFINEVVILSQINHRNVVKLLGCCLETEVPLLVYEHVPNGTLFDLIHDPSPDFPFPWNMRLNIAAAIAGAVAYLHSASAVPIFHRDIKSSNVLLDEKYVAKVADFGTSKTVSVDQTHVTTLVKGTFGYLDPEYFQSSQFTEKSDVYSFGVVLVELLTGKKPISATEEERSLVARFLMSMEGNRLGAILDSGVLEDDAIEVARIAQRCLNMKGVMRPSMKEVAGDLERLRMSQMPSIVKDEDEEVGICETTN